MVKFDKAFWSRWEVMFVIFIVIVSLIIAGGYASYSVISSQQDSVVFGLTVKNGDAVSVDYIGMFEDGTVFDTSIQSVAENNTLYPKSISFSPNAQYSPLNFTVGTGQMISGFDTGVIGMGINQTKTVIIPPEHAYGFSNSSLIVTQDLTRSIPVYEWIGNVSYFTDNFLINPDIGVNFKNPIYGWNMTVFHIDPVNGAIMVKNIPSIGEVVQLDEGWSSQVMSIDTSANMGTGEIIIKHIFTSADVGTKMFSDYSGQQFIISRVNTIDGTFTMDFNREVVGKTLIFKITLVSLTQTV